MRYLFILSFLTLATGLTSQIPTNVYLFPGLGSDERIFEKIKLDSNYKLIPVIYHVPARRATMLEYAASLIQQIDTTKKYVFIGVSIGGMLCVELAELLAPEQVAIISSAKCRGELPFRYRFQKTVPLNKIVPKGLIKLGARILQPIVEPDRKKNKSTFKSMLRAKNKAYMKRSVNMIVNWKRTACNTNIIHIHGTNDHTLPVSKIKPTHLIKNGSHMMALTRGEELNVLLLKLLKGG